MPRRLGGAGFMSSFGKRSTKDLYNFISNSMPAGAPKSLSEEQYTNVTAYLLWANGAKAGSTALNKNTDVKISHHRQRPDPPRGNRGASAPLGKMAAMEARPPRQSAPPPQGLTVKGTVKNYVDVTDEMLTHPPDGEWLMYRRNYPAGASRRSTQITPDNVKNLPLKWAWDMNEGGASQVTPIVHAGVMFLSNTSNTVQALDASTGELIWENRIGPVSKVAYGGTRSLALYHDKVFVATTDAKIHALDARTGKIVWEQTLGNPNNSDTGGVMVIRGKVLTGMTGCDNYSRTTATSAPLTPTPASGTGPSTPRRWKASRAATPGTACPTCCAAAATPGSRAPTIRS